MTDSQLNQLVNDVAYIRERVDCVDRKLGELRVSVEHRVTRLEGRASLFGVLGGFLAALATALLGIGRR